MQSRSTLGWTFTLLIAGASVFASRPALAAPGAAGPSAIARHASAAGDSGAAAMSEVPAVRRPTASAPT
jgi:hypothetical protein